MEERICEKRLPKDIHFFFLRMNKKYFSKRDNLTELINPS
tara:strand:+ start:355 stop:474 length:120 start_codon:yes stop_codon:yes gene_type:complete